MDKTNNSISLEKKLELEKIVKYVLEDSKYKDKKSVTQILLFGSYAKGSAVENPDFQVQRDGIKTVFQSDFDILVILKKQKEIKNKDSQYSIEENISKDKAIKTPVSIIFESQKDLCTYLKDERYFYKEIISEGINLWQRGKFNIKSITIEDISYKRKKQLLREDFDNYWESVESGIKTFNFLFKEKLYKKASFELHQATENLFACLLIVFIRYNPKTHNLEKLLDEWIYLKIDKNIIESIKNIFPRNTEEEKYLFNLLKRAYIESRYYKDFSVNKYELEQLFVKINNLNSLVENICKKIIKDY